MNRPCDITEAAPYEEAARLATVHGYGVLDTGYEHPFDDIAVLASHLCAAPVAFVSLVADKRTFVKSAVGITIAEASHANAFCRDAIGCPSVFEMPDVIQNARFHDHPLVVEAPNIRFFAAAPLIAPNGHAVGVLCVADFQPRHLSIEQYGALQILSRQTVAQLEVGVRALRDPLTGHYHRRYLDTVLPRELARVARRRSRLGVIAVDIDRVRTINDTYGHEAGDAVLRAVSALLTCSTHADHIVCRLAGKQFLIVMPETTVDVAAARAEALRETVASLELQFLPGVRHRMTVSAGIAAYPDHGSTPEEILAEADHALRLAKAGGRNRVVLASRGLDYPMTLAEHALAASILAA